MGQPLKLVASHTEDLYYQNYRSDNDFFTTEDFVFNVGASISDYYKQEYERLRQEARQEKQDEIIQFSADVLSQQDIEITTKDGIMTADIVEPYMSFPYDNWNCGLQEIIPAKGDLAIFKRSTIAELWKEKHIPVTNKIFWLPVSSDKLRFFKNSNCNVSIATLFYVPSPNEDMIVPDGIIKIVVDNTVMTMKQIKDGTFVKKDLDRNQNKAIETEMDKLAVR